MACAQMPAPRRLGPHAPPWATQEEFRKSEEKHVAAEELRRERRRRLRVQAETRRHAEVEAQQAKLLTKLSEGEEVRVVRQLETRAAEEAARMAAEEERRHVAAIEAQRRRRDGVATDAARQARAQARSAAMGRYEEYRQSAEQGAADRYGAEVAARRAKARQTLDTYEGGRQRVEEHAEAARATLEERRAAVEERFQQESRVLAQQQDEMRGRMRAIDKSERRHVHVRVRVRLRARVRVRLRLRARVRVRLRVRVHAHHTHA